MCKDSGGEPGEGSVGKASAAEAVILAGTDSLPAVAFAAAVLSRASPGTGGSELEDSGLVAGSFGT